MAIFEKQYKELLTRELLKVLVKGKLPNIREITEHLKKASEDKKPLYQFVPQAKRAVFNNELFNKQLNSIEFDVQLLHQDILDQIQEALRRLNYADLYHKVHSYELQKMSSLLNSILFTFENADFFFLAAFDNFSDYSKTNRSVSHPDIIYLPEKALVLPYGGKNTQRIHTNHMYNHVSWPVTILTPSKSFIVSNKQVPNTSFGDVFSDVINNWMYEVVTRESGAVSIQVKFPLAGLAKDEAEVKINRFEVVPFSTTAQRVKIEFSTDDVNWKTPQGYESGLLMTDQKLTYAMDFITELVQFVRLTIVKVDPDEDVPISQTDKQFLYRFGLKGFSAYSVGRVREAVYQSKAFDFVGQEEVISRVSMKAETATPDGTSIHFSVALGDEAGTPTTSFLPIKPVGGYGKPGATEVVVFGTTEPHSFRFLATSGQFALRETFRGHKFYKFTKPTLPLPLFGTARLIRGHQVWSRDANIALTRTEVIDNYVSFGKVDTEHLYTTHSEVPVQRAYTVSSVSRIELTTSRPVYYLGGGIHDLTPAFSQSSGDMTPKYAVYGVEYITDFPKKEFKIATANRSTVPLPIANFVLTGADAPLIRDTTGKIVYVNGKDYVINTTVVGGKARSLGTIGIPAGSGIYKGGSEVDILVTLVVEGDVTYKVEDIQSNKVTLKDMKIDPPGTAGDSFKITYRFIPLPPNTIVKSSVRVKDSISNNPHIKYYLEGTDYVLNIKEGAIQRLPNGNIPAQGDVFVDYLYRNSEDNVETFLTWCLVPGTIGRRIHFKLDPTTRKNALVADETIGEQFLVNIPGGLIDLTQAETSPIIGPGWVQFIVKSKNPDANQQANGKDNLIDQVIQARDINNKRIFKEKGSYFKDILAFRNPMVQTSLNQLRINTLPSNHLFFAIDDTKITEPVIVLNFNPGDTKELYLKIPQDEDSVEPKPLDYFEAFTVSWQSKIVSESSGSSVVVRCNLSRDADIDGGITPKVFEYFLRASDL